MRWRGFVERGGHGTAGRWNGFEHRRENSRGSRQVMGCRLDGSRVEPDNAPLVLRQLGSIVVVRLEVSVHDDAGMVGIGFVKVLGRDDGHTHDARREHAGNRRPSE